MKLVIVAYVLLSISNGSYNKGNVTVIEKFQGEEKVSYSACQASRDALNNTNHFDDAKAICIPVYNNWSK